MSKSLTIPPKIIPALLTIVFIALKRSQFNFYSKANTLLFCVAKCECKEFSHFLKQFVTYGDAEVNYLHLIC